MKPGPRAYIMPADRPVMLDFTPGANRVTKEQWYECAFPNLLTRSKDIENFEKTRYLTPCRCTWDLCSGWQVAWRDPR